jgi:hypothetical protein
MRQQIERRLAELHTELAEGQRMLAELEARESTLRDQQLRISGAIQMLEELLKASPRLSEPANRVRSSVGDDGDLQAVTEFGQQQIRPGAPTEFAPSGP